MGSVGWAGEFGGWAGREVEGRRDSGGDWGGWGGWAGEGMEREGEGVERSTLSASLILPSVLALASRHTVSRVDLY